MKRTTINGLVAGLFVGMLASCGGTSDSSSGSKLLGDQAACYQTWNSNIAYSGGQSVSYGGKNYTAAYWTQGQNPSTNSGPAGSGQPWLTGVSCNGDPGVTPTPTPPPTPTPTPPPTCTPTPIVPYIQVNGGTVWQTSSMGVTYGSTVKFSPQPSTGGSWTWSGCGTSGTSREQTITYAGSCTAVPVYTNSCGAQSTVNLVLSTTIVEPPPTPTPQPTPTPTPPPTCTPTTITPYLQVNGGALLQTSSYIVRIGDTVKLSPQPSTGGSWSWNGGCGTNGTAREQTISGGTCSAITTYTNSCGAISSQTFVLTLSEQPPTPTPVPTPPPTSCPQYVSGHAYATGAKVTNVGNYYQCTVGGWCSQGGAYDPGTGWAWTNAWSQITASQCSGTPTPAPTPTPTPAPTPAPTPTPTPAPTPAPTGCAAGWVSTKSYIAGDEVMASGHNYQARFFTQGQNPLTNSGPAAGGYPWADLGPCYIVDPTPAPTPTPTPAP